MENLRRRMSSKVLKGRELTKVRERKVKEKEDLTDLSF